jgi:hypothetical protein
MPLHCHSLLLTAGKLPWLAITQLGQLNERYKLNVNIVGLSELVMFWESMG